VQRTNADNPSVQFRKLLPTLDEQQRWLPFSMPRTARSLCTSASGPLLDQLFNSLLHKLMPAKGPRLVRAQSAQSSGGCGLNKPPKISEAGFIQFQMVKHTAEIGCTPIGPDVAEPETRR
jgi:hypothetical protein